MAAKYQNATIILVGTVITLLIVAGILYYSVTINSSGSIFIKTVNCAVYYDSQGKQPITAIDWGQQPPDSAINQTIYIKNTSNVAVNFTVTTTTWNPSNANQYITLDSDLKGQINIAPNSIVPCVLTERISADITGITNYSYTITVTAAG